LLIKDYKPVHFFTWGVPPYTLNCVPLQNSTALHVPQAVFAQIQFGYSGIVLWIGALVPYFNFKLSYFNVFCTFNMRKAFQVIFLNQTEKYTKKILEMKHTKQTANKSDFIT
jgi:hypothetical protein